LAHGAGGADRRRGGAHAFYAWPLQTVLYIAQRNGLAADDPRLRDALQRRAILRRGERDRALVQRVLPG